MTGRMTMTKSVVDDVEKELKRSGVDNSLYLSKEADSILDRCKARTRRSRSLVASMLIEKYGPAVEKDPGLLNV